MEPNVKRESQQEWLKKDDYKYDRKDKPIVIPPKKVIPLTPRPIKCGACGVVFEIGKPIFYSCSKIECPLFLKNYMGLAWKGGGSVSQTM